MQEARNPETTDTATHQLQHQSSTGWLSVVTKAVSKADNAVLNLVDRLPTITNTSRRESIGNEAGMQQCLSCHGEQSDLNRMCNREHCKCKCHQNPTSSLFQARRTHTVVQRNMNRKPQLDKRNIVKGNSRTNVRDATESNREGCSTPPLQVLEAVEARLEARLGNRKPNLPVRSNKKKTK